MSALTVACVQHCPGQDLAQNRQQIDAAISDAAASGARLIVLPELHDLPYFPQRQSTAAFDLAEPLDGPTTQRLGKLARLHSAVIVGSLFEAAGPGVFHNTAVVLESDGSLAGCYRKTHIPDDPGYHEKFYFTPGEEITPLATSVGRLGLLVCWDQWFPEAARVMALGGADLLLYPTAIGWDQADTAREQTLQFTGWRNVQLGHAAANLLPVLVANRTGGGAATDYGARFWGGSFIAGPRGELLTAADHDSATVIAANIDYAESEALRRIWPFFRDRRLSLYRPLLGRGGPHNSGGGNTT